MTSSDDLLSFTAFASILIHAVIILGVSFNLPELADVKNADNTLDVVLINSANNLVPTEAETVSTNNNDGGGNDEIEASSPLPYKAVNSEPIESVKMVADQETKTELNPDRVITAASADFAISALPPSDTQIEVKQQQQGEDKITTQARRKLERERLIAKLQKDWKDYQQRPRKEFLSPSTKQNDAAKYLDAWRRKVEHVGNANYPIQAKAKSLSGNLILSVEINRNGTLSSVNILKPSPHQILNDSAIRFVKEAAPYESFPSELDPETDILVITRAFHFLGTNHLTSTDASSTR